jgi:hypothetical protein
MKNTLVFLLKQKIFSLGRFNKYYNLSFDFILFADRIDIMIMPHVQNLIKKYQGKVVRFYMEPHEIIEGVMLGQWKDEHFTFISFSHADQKADISHININRICMLKNVRELGDTERKNILHYFKALNN